MKRAASLFLFSLPFLFAVAFGAARPARAVDATVVSIDQAAGTMVVRKAGETRTSVVAIGDATLIMREGQPGAVGIDSLQPGDVVVVDGAGSGTAQRVVVRPPPARVPAGGAMSAPSGRAMSPPSGSALSPGSGKALPQGGQRKQAGSGNDR